jgi:hypothetical protein
MVASIVIWQILEPVSTNQSLIIYSHYWYSLSALIYTTSYMCVCVVCVGAHACALVYALLKLEETDTSHRFCSHATVFHCNVFNYLKRWRMADLCMVLPSNMIALLMHVVSVIGRSYRIQVKVLTMSNLYQCQSLCDRMSPTCPLLSILQRLYRTLPSWYAGGKSLTNALRDLPHSGWRRLLHQPVVLR